MSFGSFHPSISSRPSVYGRLLSAQRLYNLPCIAYGSDKQLFADVVAITSRLRPAENSLLRPRRSSRRRVNEAYGLLI